TGASVNIARNYKFFELGGVRQACRTPNHVSVPTNSRGNSPKTSETALLAGTNSPQFRWPCRRGHLVVTPAPGGVPRSPRQKPSGALTFSGTRLRHNRSMKVSHAVSASAESHTHASLANHSCSRAQTGH